MNEKTTNKTIAKSFQAKFENHIATKSFDLLSTDIFTALSKTFACNMERIVPCF